MTSRSFAGVLFASAAAHAVVVDILPSRAPTRERPLEPTAVEIVDAPPPPPPTETPDTPEVRETPTRVAKASPAPTALRAAAAPDAPPPAADAIADFTATVLASDGPGIAIGVGTAGGAPNASIRAKTPPPALPIAPRHVAATNLSRLPRPPALDGALERQYPAAARNAGVSGIATLKVEILADGRVGAAVALSESYPGFANACERTVRTARWEPPLDRDGRTVATEITYTCRFEVRS
jgi:protein TonB